GTARPKAFESGATGSVAVAWKASRAPIQRQGYVPISSAHREGWARRQNGVKGGASSARRRRRATPRSARRHHHRRDTAPATETLSTRTARTRWGERGQATG